MLSVYCGNSFGNKSEQNWHIFVFSFQNRWDCISIHLPIWSVCKGQMSPFQWRCISYFCLLFLLSLLLCSHLLSLESDDCFFLGFFCTFLSPRENYFGQQTYTETERNVHRKVLRHYNTDTYITQTFPVQECLICIFWWLQTLIDWLVPTLFRPLWYLQSLWEKNAI